MVPLVRHGKPVFAVLVADRGKVKELFYDLATGATAKATKHAAPAH
jgi:hypothetical protein